MKTTREIELGKNNKHFSERLIILSFLCMSGIIFAHAENINLAAKESLHTTAVVTVWIEAFIYRFAGGTGLQTFFIISGFLFFKNYNDSMYFSKLKSRVYTLLYPYLIWNSIYYIIYGVFSVYPGLAKGQMIGSGLPTFTLIDILQGVFLNKYSGVLWYLLQLIILAVLAPLIYRIVKNKVGAALFIIGALIITVIDPLQVHIFRAISVPGYCLGAYMAINHREFVMKKADKKTLTIAVCLFGVGIIGFFLLGNLTQKDHSLHVIFTMITACGLVFIVDFLPLHEMIKTFMKYTFFAYLTHWLVLVLIKTIIKMFLPQTDGLLIVYYVFTAVLTIFITLYSGMIIHKRFARLYGVLCGQRGEKQNEWRTRVETS